MLRNKNIAECNRFGTRRINHIENRNMYFDRVIMVCLAIGIIALNSCIVSKESRQLKSQTKEWRDSPIRAEAYADTPLSGEFITLRQNHKFERTSTGMFKAFGAGDWSIGGDTLYLSYLDTSLSKIKTETLVLNESNSTLVLTQKGSNVDFVFKIIGDWNF